MEDEKQVPPPSPDVEVMDDRKAAPDAVRTTKNGVALIPRPSNDPRDPLNWSMGRKVTIVSALCLATFAGFTACLAGQMIPVPQSKLYKTTTTRMAYQVPIANSGMILGGFVWFPISHKIGRSATAFWSLVGVFICQIWSANMTHSHDYARFMISRFFSGFFGTVAGVIGPRVLVDLFFLHQRGRAFTIFHCALDMGTVAGPTLSAFISSGHSWTSAFWWTTALSGFAALTCFCFLYETSWNREEGADNTLKTAPDGWFASRWVTFFPGSGVTPDTSFSQCLAIAAKPFQIAVTPAMVLIGIFNLVNFGMYVAMNAITPVWIQKPVKAGGYAFSSHDNALFSFNHWVGLAIAVLYGQLVSDRLPLWICARRGGKWKPEYRLHALWFPALICNPIGLGLFGVTLNNRWHWGILAFAQGLVTFGSEALIPISVNYACEIFTKNPAETAIIMNVYRIAFGLSVTFYVSPWVANVSFRWAYGTMAFLQVASFFCVMLLMWKGHEIRKLKVGNLINTEEGEQVIEGQAKE